MNQPTSQSQSSEPTGGAQLTVSQLTTVSSYGNEAPSTRVRVQDWLDHLGLDAISLNYAGLPDATVSSIRRHPVSVLRAEFHIRRLSKAPLDRLLLSREASPFSRGEVESGLLLRATHGTYDFDDALFEDVEGRRRLLGKGVKCRRAAESADVVIAGNEYLADWASTYNDEVRVIPSCVAPSMYRAKTSWELQDPPMLVWLGSRSTEKYVEQLGSALREVNRLTGARLRLISQAKEQEHPSLAGIVDRRPWSLETFADELATGDIALAPLDSSRYSMGKCAYKLLQYAATGLPIVGSPVGANSVALERFSGTAVTNMNDWVDALVAMIRTTSEDRGARGATGIRAVNEHYSFTAWSSAWKGAVGLS